MNMKSAKIALATLGLAVAPSLFAATTGDSTVTAVVAAEASISTISNPTLTKGGTNFESWTGSTTFTYIARTSETTGTGSITATVATATFFSGSNIAVADLTYTTAKSGSVGTVVSSATAVATAGTNILTAFGAGAHTTDAGDTGTISWTLADRAAYKTGTHTAVVTLSISVT